MYFFLAGVGAGAYVAGVVAQFAGAEGDTIVKIGVTIGSPLVAFSTLFLVWDLGRPFGFYRSGLHPSTSWISEAVAPALLGGYVLRHLVITAGVKAPLVVIGRLVPIPGRPRLVS